MALQPSLSAQLVVGTLAAPHTLEFFYDTVCPFSAKSAVTLESVLRPLIDNKYKNRVKVIIRLHPQPWHASSTLTQEGVLAVLKVNPAQFWPYLQALFKRQTEYFDEPTSTLTPVQIREKLVQLAEPLLTGEQVTQVKELLKLNGWSGTPNSGTGVTDDLKYNIKYSRQNSIHGSPTVLFDGLIAPEVSSGWGEAEWSELLSKKVTA